MQFKTILYTTFSVTLLLTACQKDKEVNASVDATENVVIEGEAVATVNGVAVTKAQVDEYIEYRNSVGQPAQEPLDDLILLEALKQEAIAARIDQDTMVKARIARVGADALANALLKETVSFDVSEEELKAKYEADNQQQATDTTEFNSSHILVEKEEEAEAIIKLLNDGKDFSALAKEKSTGPSGANGGELGWASPEAYVPEFSAAMVELEVGAVTQKPVKTQFGWHVIKLNDKRVGQAKPAAQFSTIKNQLRQIIIQERIKSLIDDARAKADIVKVVSGVKDDKVEDQSNIDEGNS